MTLGHGSSSLLGARREELCQAGQEGIAPTSNEVADLALELREVLPEVRLGIELQAQHYIAEPLRPMGRGDKNAMNAVGAHPSNKRNVTHGHGALDKWVIEGRNILCQAV